MCIETKFLTSQLKSLLKEAGFPADSMDLEYSLSYSQGDGVAFYGQLNAKEMITLYSKIFEDKDSLEIEKFSQLVKKLDNFFYFEKWCEPFEALIQGNQFSHRYSHYNTMDLDIVDISDFFDGDALSKDEETTIAENYWFFDSSELDEYKFLWYEFVHDLKDYIIQTSKLLEKAGYQLIEQYIEYDEAA
ncbi:hypothetical protein QJU87_04295 [Pasteurella skyensis]|uniref:hypothetical protein n=1 Tax=Phocoenobacter skyensis TaxID=97481 RepID=UPI00274E6018|nr:hypothetical protein [Pasteurella skyensis]MDP8189085.1 hypothetical protein [Pasteurella skyensis]